MKIVIPDDDPAFYGAANHPELGRLEAYGEVRWYGTRYPDREEFFRRCAEAEVVVNVRGYSKFDEEALERLPRLKLVSVVGTGTDNVDLAAARRRDVTITNTPGVNSGAVAELALGLMLSTARHIALGDRWMRAGLWQQRRGPELRGRTLGLVGVGLIAQRLAHLARGIGMQVIGWSFTQDPERAAAAGIELVERDDVFRRADVVSVHVRSTPETRGFVGRRELKLMKSSAILINTARGAVVDAPALREALVEGSIAGAGLDVHLPEPLPPDQNLFKDLDNAVITPHLGGSSFEAATRTQQVTVDNVIAYLEGRPEHVANP